jgi:hypothetical protein
MISVQLCLYLSASLEVFLKKTAGRIMAGEVHLLKFLLGCTKNVLEHNMKTTCLADLLGCSKTDCTGILYGSLQ